MMQQIASSESSIKAVPDRLPESPTIPEAEVSFESVLSMAIRLPPADKARLLVYLASAVQHALALVPPPPTERVQILGLWQGLSITEDDIAEARREMWGNFPREDI